MENGGSMTKPRRSLSLRRMSALYQRKILASSRLVGARFPSSAMTPMAKTMSGAEGMAQPFARPGWKLVTVR